MGTTVIIPAVLPRNEGELLDCFGQVKGVAEEIHLDICDGRFTPEKSWPYNSETELQKFLNASAKEDGLPFWQDFDFEIHLMTRESLSGARSWFAAGASRIIVHSEEITDLKELAQYLDHRAKIGLALCLPTPLGEIAKHADFIDFVHMMSIADLGYQGGEFDERIFDRIEEVKDLYPDLEVSVDGGVGEENAGALLSAGANRLIVGSAIFAEGKPRDNYERILRAVGG